MVESARIVDSTKYLEIVNSFHTFTAKRAAAYILGNEGEIDIQSALDTGDEELKATEIFLRAFPLVKTGK